MDFLKGVISDDLYEKLSAELGDKKDVKIGNLAGGAYVDRAKFDAQIADKEALKTQLDDANATIERLNASAGDSEAIKKERDEYRARAEAAEAEKTKIAEDYAIDGAISNSIADIKFSSNAARAAFVSDLKAKKLPIEDGKILGFNEFRDGYEKEAFLSDKPQPQIPQFMTGTTAVADSGNPTMSENIARKTASLFETK